MTATAFSRGWPIEWTGSKWVFLDTQQSIDIDERSCYRCDRPPTLEGYDACLGYLLGVSSACCGHGRCDPYVKDEV